MNATVRFLIISTAIIIPWGFVRVIDLEVRDIIQYTGLGDAGIIALLIIPPITLFLTKWLFGPRGKQNKRYSVSKNVMIKFRG